jgi:archaeal cell division control protein 6
MKDQVDEIFRRAKEGRTLFKDQKTLTPDYIPDELPFRTKQMSEIAGVLGPALQHSKPSNLLLYGKTGTGKTAVANNIVRRLAAQSNGSIQIPYVNTRSMGTEYRTLSEIGAQLGIKVPMTGLSIGEVVGRIFKDIQTRSANVILVLDEIDYLVNTYNDDILYQFTRAGDRIAPGFLSIIGISNNLTFKEGLDPRVLSSLGEEELVFPPYTTDELRSILSERAKAAFRPGVVPDSTINLCAALAGSEHGDARRAVELLRVAGEVAEREGYQKVDEECLRTASDKVDRDRVEEALLSLPLQNKIIILAVSKFTSGSNTGELYLAYTNMARKSGVEVLTQRRVSGILAELDLLGLIEATIVSKGRRGRTKRIKILIDEETIGRVVKGDVQLTDVL